MTYHQLVSPIINKGPNGGGGVGGVSPNPLADRLYSDTLRDQMQVVGNGGPSLVSPSRKMMLQDLTSGGHANIGTP